MPVILRNRNISTELGITNGSQGILRKIFTRVCASNFSVAQCAIVEFPDSNVEIPGLPPRHFPLTPVPWKFTTTMADSSGTKRNVHVSRSQLNLQPAFAVTGHAAQGKTLPQVLVDLREGGFAAYVSASRARTREGLFLTETVSLDKLNRPVNNDLRHECRRLERLEHNTKVRHGIVAGPILPALDPETETSISDAGMAVPLSTADKNLDLCRSQSELAPPPPAFRPNPPDCGSTSWSELAPLPPAFRPGAPTCDNTLRPGLAPPPPVFRSGAPACDNTLQSELAPPPPSSSHPNPPDHDSVSPPPAGCTWYLNSCAYDAFFMAMFSMYRGATETWKHSFHTMGPWFSFLSGRFEHLTISSNLTNTRKFCESRDELRKLLSQHDAGIFPPPGQRHTSVFRVFENFEKNSSRSFTLSQKFICSGGCLTERDILYLPNACSSGAWTNAARRTGFSCVLEDVSIQLFIDLQIAAKIQQGLRSRCDQCHHPRTSSVFLSNPSPWLFFLLPRNVQPHPQLPPALEIRGSAGMLTYRLSAVIYYNGTHFTSAWINKDATCWGHDGLARNGRPERLHSADLTRLQSYANCDPHIALYDLDCSVASYQAS